MAYLLKIKPEQMEKLYCLREERKNKGQKSSITGMVRDAIAWYLGKHEDEVEEGNRLVAARTSKLAELEKEHARKNR